MRHEAFNALGLGEVLIFAACMAPAVHIDLASRRIPDLSLLLAAAGLLAVRGARGAITLDQITGALSSFLLFLAVWLPARRRMGFGDVKLAGLIGFLVGFPGWLLAVAAASLGGIVYVLARSAAGGRARDESIAFAPFLAAAAVAAALALPFLGVA